MASLSSLNGCLGPLPRDLASVDFFSMIPTFINLFSRYLYVQNIFLDDRNIVFTKSKHMHEIYIVSINIIKLIQVF